MKIKLLIALIVLSFGLSCATSRRTLEPEVVVRDYIEAIATDNCYKATSYWLSENRSEFYRFCREAKCKIVETRIDAVEPEFDPRNLEQNQVMVFALHGHFLHRCDDTGEEYVTNSVHIYIMRRGDIYYVSGVEK